MSKIITVTGPSLVGKSTFSNALKRALNERRHSTKKLVRATTRALRAGEGEGPEYKIYTEEEMNAATDAKSVIGAYRYADHRYGVLKGSIDTSVEYNLAAIRDPVGVTNLTLDTDMDLVPVILFSEKWDIDQRVAQKMRELRERGEIGIEEKLSQIRSRLDDFDREFPEFVKMMPEYKFILFNPNVHAGDELVAPQKIVEHLAHRLVDILEFESDNSSLNNSDFRERYIDSIVGRLFNGLSLKDLEKKAPTKLKINDEAVRKYNTIAHLDSGALKKLTPHIIGTARGYGVFSIYISQDPEAKKHLLNLLELQAGLPQYRFDGLEQDVVSPMSFTYIQNGYSNFYLSFSAAYDTGLLSRRESPVHTLAIEATDASKADQIRVLDHEAAEKELGKRTGLIRRSSRPYKLD